MLKVYRNFSLSGFNTFGLDVKASAFVSYDSESDIASVLERLGTLPKPYLHIGRGSNLLFTGDYPGTILHSEINYIKEFSSDGTSVVLKAGSGVLWDDLCRFAAEHGYYGIENLSYIPGEVGAAAVQNIGAYGADVSQVIENVYAVDVETGSRRVFENKECAYAYRDSVFKNSLLRKYIIVAVSFRLSTLPEVNLEYGQLKELKNMDRLPTVSEVRDKVIEIRRSKLPDYSELGNAGSFFKNPVVTEEKFKNLLEEYPDMPHYIQHDGVKIPAAFLIEQCGWKGKSHGGASVYEKQPLIIVNTGSAVAGDIIALADEIQASVKEKFGIEINPEVNYI